MKSYVLNFIFLGIFVVLVGVFFYPTLLYGKLPVPADTLVGLYHPWRDLYSGTNPRGIPFKNFLITDPVRQQIPWRKIVIDEWKAGKLPSWNPYSFSGSSLIGNIQAAVFYPGNIIFWLLPFIWGWTVLIVAQPLLAGIWMFLYLRHLKFSVWTCLLGAVAWSFSGFHIAWLTWGTIGHVSLWLPLLLLAIDKIIGALTAKRAWMWGIVLAGSLSFSFFAGHAQVFLYILSLSLVYACWSLYGSRQLKVGSRILIIVCALVVSLLVTFVQWMPFMSVVRESSRLAERLAWQKEGWFLPWQHLVQFIAPDFFGNPATLNYWGKWNYGEFVGYIGLVPFLFAVMAFIHRQQRTIVFWIAVGLFVLTCSLPSPISTFVYQLHLPLVSSLQPTRLMVIVDFAFVMLSAYGFEKWMLGKTTKGNVLAVIIVGIFIGLSWIFSLYVPNEQTQVVRRNLIIPSIVYALSAALVLVGLLRRDKLARLLLAVIFIGITVVDLFRFGWKFTPFTPTQYFFPPTKVITFLQKQDKPFRFMSLDDKILPANVSAYYGLESIEGYDPLYLRRYEQYIGSSEKGTVELNGPYGFNRIITAHNRRSSLLEFLNVKYVLSLEEIHDTSFVKVFEEGMTKVYRYVRGNARVYFAFPIVQVPNEAAQLENMLTGHEDDTHIAYVSDSVPVLQTPLGWAQAHISDYAADSMKIETDATQDRFLVIANILTPQSHVAIDGVLQKIYRTNYLFMGVQVPAGKHIITTYIR